MNVLIDIGHPGHVHLFRPMAQELLARGHKVLCTCRQKEFEIELIADAGLPYVCFGKHFKTRLGKLWGLLKFDIQMIKTALGFRPDIFISHGSMYAAQAAWLLHKPHVALEDTYNLEQVRLYRPFSPVILTGDYSHPSMGDKEVRYSAYHELAYLHPKHFVADNSVIDLLKGEKKEKYAIVRFVSWQATHDAGSTGISLENKFETVRRIGQTAKVYISSEAELPEDLKAYQFPLPPSAMHSALAGASLFLGESATMAMEAALLGVPSIVINNARLYNIDDLQKTYSLLHSFSESHEDQKKAMAKAVDILTRTDSFESAEKRRTLLETKIDLSAFLVWFLENYPNSKDIMHKDPDYQKHFR